MPYVIPSVDIALPVTHNDDVDATKTSGSLTTAAPGVVHLAIVASTIAVPHAVP